GGSWLTPAEVLARGDWAQVTKLAVQACGLARHPA
ncbi:MAG: keto-deoxy-phosphogluconate aldolase, partial [Polaromonas sp.]|nr:keto-deoxy-phosphogluconate aldolase [Polaromonas sp.]